MPGRRRESKFNNDDPADDDSGDDDQYSADGGGGRRRHLEYSSQEDDGDDEDGGGLFGGDQHDGSGYEDSDDDGGYDDDASEGDAQARATDQAKREEAISVKAWLLRKQHYTPIMDLLPKLIKFLSGDFDPLDDEESHGIPLVRRFMDCDDEGECQRFIGSCLAAVHAYMDRRYRALGYKQPKDDVSDGDSDDGGGSGGGGGGRGSSKRRQPKGKKRGKKSKAVRDSDWPTDLAKRFAQFLSHKDTEFVFENVPVKPAFYEQYSKYGKRSFEKIRKASADGGGGDDGSGSDGGGGGGGAKPKEDEEPVDPNEPSHMKNRVVFAYGVAQKGKAPKPLKPDEVLTNKLFKRQCKVLWRKLLRQNEEKVHKMVSRELYKRTLVSRVESRQHGVGWK